MESLKREFLELLDKDIEFRYAVAGYLGLSEILKRLDAIAEEQAKIWVEIKALREEQVRLRGEQAKIWEEIRALREEQAKIWGEITKVWEEIKALREEQANLRREQARLAEEQVKIWEEIRALREGQNRLFEAQSKLFEGQSRLWEEVRALRISQEKLWENQERLWRYVRDGFRDLRRALGMTFEDYARSFMEFYLDGLGYPGARVERKILIHEGKILEIDIFCEEPLVVGEATLTISSVDDAEREVGKVLERARVVEGLFGRRPMLTVLAVANVPQDLIGTLEDLARKHGVKVVLGKEISELL